MCDLTSLDTRECQRAWPVNGPTSGRSHREHCGAVSWHSRDL